MGSTAQGVEEVCAACAAKDEIERETPQATPHDGLDLGSVSLPIEDVHLEARPEGHEPDGSATGWVVAVVAGDGTEIERSPFSVETADEARMFVAYVEKLLVRFRSVDAVYRLETGATASAPIPAEED